MKKIVMSALTLAIAACMSATPVISASASDDDFVCGTELIEQELREREFEDISIKAPTKYFYQYGDKLDLSGGAIYADNMLVCYMDSPENCFLPDAQVEIDTHQFVNSDFGVYPINVRVKINGKEFRQIFCVAVEEPENAEIELADVTIADEAEEVQATGFETLKIKVPDKKYYQYGEKLDLTGGEIYAGDKFICSMTDPTANVEIDTHQFVNSTFGSYPVNVRVKMNGKEFNKVFCVAVEEPEDAEMYFDYFDIAADEDISYGDVNLDGRVSISDSVAILQFIANPEKYALTDEQKANADVHNTGDGVTLKDAEAISAFAEGMIDLF